MAKNNNIKNSCNSSFPDSWPFCGHTQKMDLDKILSAGLISALYVTFSQRTRKPKHYFLHFQNGGRSKRVLLMKNIMPFLFVSVAQNVTSY